MGALYLFLPRVTTDELRFERSPNNEDSIARIMAHAWDSDRYDDLFVDIHFSQLQDCMGGKPATDWIPLSILPGAIPADAEVCESGDEWYVPPEFWEAGQLTSFDQCYQAMKRFNNLKGAGLLLNGEPAPFDSFGCLRDLRDSDAE